MDEEKKHKIILSVIEKLTEERGRIEASLKAARQAAVDAPGAMQSHSDTTKFQMGILADNIAKTLEDKKLAIQELTMFAGRRAYHTSSVNIKLGSLVHVKTNDGEIKLYFILPAGSGTEIMDENRHFFVIGPSAPIAAVLLGKSEGDTVTLRLPAKTNMFFIEKVE
ncbi:MAG: GreA/GreB family elongation factor [Pseudomonadota bacterium]